MLIEPSSFGFQKIPLNLFGVVDLSINKHASNKTKQIIPLFLFILIISLVLERKSIILKNIKKVNLANKYFKDSKSEFSKTKKYTKWIKANPKIILGSLKISLK